MKNTRFNECIYAFPRKAWQRDGNKKWLNLVLFSLESRASKLSWHIGDGTLVPLISWAKALSAKISNNKKP